MTMLQILWFFLIGLLFAAFFFLDGFDYGVGMAVKTLAHNEAERTQLIRTIGPVWDGNEVWLITAGGAMFASFPYWYATLFSGYYLILLVILVGLIIRGVSFEFRAQSPMAKKPLWDNALALGSLIVPFFFGVMFISMIKGMPIDAQGNIQAHFFDYFNWFSIVGGVALTLLTYLHGLNYIALKTTGAIQARAQNYSQAFYWVLYLGEVVFALLLLFQTDFIKVHPLATLLGLALIVAFSVLAHANTFKNRNGWAFVFSGLTLVSLVALLFSGLFPRLMISSISSQYDLMIKSASSSNYTLIVMTIATLVLVPCILVYTAFAYWIFRKRIEMPRVEVR
ncbi:cytochrome d ubiquinol oxidase subunit II [Limosilactobacillus mucosae]|jgi:cytochrome d ubiquinol oxidase subunit II|uniref:Cytochrome d ubiquinol oxidase subunit II n=1 Tax=Limosilactobacillus mucosae TaxID=97478 RepID=A0AAJ1HQL6_LIMMU|nr:cytochrome d ubiquinol oxidase subunit II [Limosilactobacillus mucosae]MDC2826830.1 cytochrome d ubiquinol oxidase subunit II [Limosilactobacillus mucosae]MDC2836222.1 cytochrome d ubiquinol oxidase subunit II [Limosilactobacillus mucosae]MDC2853238.1 cytochrome d ubiquinol oxidase subunit II [Limosilactobacillus mucosae]